MGTISRQDSITTSTTSTIVAPTRYNRKGFYITNTSAAAVVTITKGDVAAVQNSGVVLQPKGSFFEVDGAEFKCWRGAIQVISDVAGSVAIQEDIEV